MQSGESQMGEAKGLNYNNKLSLLTQGIGHGSVRPAALDEKTFSDMGLWLVRQGYADTIAPHQSNQMEPESWPSPNRTYRAR